MKRLILFLSACLTLISFYSRAQSESDLVINEIMYNQPGNDTIEFVEIYNRGLTAPTVNLQGYYFSSGLSLTFPSYQLDSGKYVVVARYKEVVDSVFEVQSIQWDSGGLDNTGEKIVLKDPSGNIADSVEYNDKFPWNNQADGGGYSLILCNPSLDNSTYMTWNVSNIFDGLHFGALIFASPGKANGPCTPPGDIVPPSIVNTRTLSLTQVELTFSEPVFNYSDLTNYSGLNITAATTGASPEVVNLDLAGPLTANTRYNLEVRKVEDSVANIMDTTIVHVGYNNTKPALVITEILYDHPGQDSLEFIEVQYIGQSPAPLGGLIFSSGVTFMFPTITANPGQIILIADGPTNLLTYFGSAAAGAHEWSDGSLDNTGEKLIISNSLNDTVFYVDYDTLAPWPEAQVVTASIVNCNDYEAGDPNNGSNWSFTAPTGKAVSATPGALHECLNTAVKDGKVILARIYPVPAKGYFHVEMEEAGNYRIIVADLSGKSLIEKEITNTDRFIVETGPGLLPGVYLINIQEKDSGISVNRKIILH